MDFIYIQNSLISESAQTLAQFVLLFGDTVLTCSQLLFSRAEYLQYGFYLREVHYTNCLVDAANVHVLPSLKRVLLGSAVRTVGGCSC